MNHVTRAAQVAGQWQPTDRPARKLPVCVRLGPVVFVAIALIVLGQLLQLRLGIQPSDPFSDYEEILPGHRLSARIALRFYCVPNRGASEYEYCTSGSADGPFSLVAVTLLNGIVNRVDFIVAEDRLTTGDLANLWGRPLVHLYGTSVNFEWPKTGVTARGWAVNGKFSYFIPLHHVSLAKPAS